MPSVKALYLIESATMKDDGDPFIEINFTRCYDPAFKDDWQAPLSLTEQFRGSRDLRRADDLITCGERIACMFTEWQGRSAITMIAKESELPTKSH